jgi:hypothetical protein
VLRGLHGNSFTRGALADRSATQKSCKGSGSAAFTALTKAMAQSATKSILIMSKAALTDAFTIVAAIRIMSMPQTLVLDREASVQESNQGCLIGPVRGQRRR